jgi:hypothetical protein
MKTNFVGIANFTRKADFLFLSLECAYIQIMERQILSLVNNILNQALTH